MRKNVGYSVIVYDDNNKSCETVIVSSCRGLNGDRFQQYEQYCTAVKAGKWSFTMTYVEFFDKIASENISACLTYVPDRVIYIGDDYKVMNKHIVNYNKVFSERGYNIEFIAKSVSKSNLENAVKLLSEIVEAYDDCVFDITGGEEILNLALGVVYSKYPDKNIQIHKFNLRNNAIYDCDKDGKTIYKETPTLSIDENIRIYGGEVVYGTVDEENTYKWDLNSEFLNDINLIWNKCKEDVRYWNVQMGIFDAAENVGRSTEKLTTVASIAEIERCLAKNRAKYKIAKGIINYLIEHGLITYFEDDGKTLTVSYKNEQVKRCLTKAGQALEMKVYITAKNIFENTGAPVYDDILNGVVIDWDGEFHDENVENVYDTENEIDIMMMHDIVPVFVSCKSGVVTSDELYKLNTVAERFGGKYAKKVLVAASLSEMGEAGEYIRQRAKDMKINLIEDIQDMSDEKLKKKLRTVWCN